MSTLVQRTLSGAVYVAVITGTVLVPDSVWFAFVALLMTVLGIREFVRLTGRDTWLTVMSSLTGVCIVLSVWMVAFLSNKPLTPDGDGLYEEGRGWMPGWLPDAILAVLVISVLVTLTAEVYRKGKDPVKNWGRYCQSQLMTAVPFACMAALCELRPFHLLALFVSIWVNDTGAYLVGMATSHLPGGNHKMSPRVSPKKSWEGLIGGICFSLLAGYVFFRVGWMDDLWVAMAFVLLASLSGTLGDLMESAMKRSVGVKDSGRFMPGHGGVLDRFDSMLLAAPVICIYLVLVSLLTV